MIPEYVPEDNRQARVGNHEPPSIPDRSRFTGQFAGASATEIDSASFRHLGARHPFEKQIYCAGLRLLPDCGSTVLHPPRWAVGESRQARSSLAQRSEEHTSELQSLMRISYAVFCLKKKK